MQLGLPVTKPKRKRKFVLTAPVVPEHLLQKQIADAMLIEVARAGVVSDQGVVWWSVDHANYAGEVPGVRVGRGIIAGIPDFFILYNGLACFIELKSAKGVLSNRQSEMLKGISRCGGSTAVVRSCAGFFGVLDMWGIPRKRILHLD